MCGALSGALMQKKVNVLTDTKAIELVQDDSGRVIGIKAAPREMNFHSSKKRRTSLPPADSEQI